MQETMEDLFGLSGPTVALAPDLAPEETPLTDEQRGALAARDRLAETMGADKADIHVLMEDIGLRLMEGGVIVDIDICRWTGMKRLLPKELGLNGKQTRTKAIKLGEKLLMPPTILRAIDSLSVLLRRNLERHSTLTVWGAWVPARAYQEWRQKHDELAAEYLKLGHSLADNLDQVRAGTGGTWGELRRLYSEHARVVWCRLNHLPAEDHYLDQCPAYFVDDYVDEIFSFIPAAATIRRSFRVEAKISYIPLPSMLEEDRVRKDQLWQIAADERQADLARTEAQEAMEADVRAHYAGQKKEMIDSFLGNLAGAIYSRVYDVSSGALATMAQNQGRLLEPTLRQLRGLIDWATMMNVSDDKELSTGIAELRGLIGRSTDMRSGTEIQDHLKALGTVARSILVDLDVTPTVRNSKLSLDSRDTALGIGPKLSRATVAKARQQLGTDAMPELLVVRARRGARPAAIQTISNL